MKELNIFEKMRGIYTLVTDIRRKVFAEISKTYFGEKTIEEIEEIAYRLIQKDSPHYRCCRYVERGIVKERVRLGLGFDTLTDTARETSLIANAKQAKTSEKILQMPIVQVIELGCEKCPTDSVFITDLCQKCIAHPCIIVCPRNAITMEEERAVVNDEKCILCGKCIQVCPYNAPVRRGRPCAQACGVDAITTNEVGVAEIDPDKCVSCGMCIVSCPFGAIGEKSEIVQVIECIKSPDINTYAIVAPSFVSQFGPQIKPEAIFEGILQLGFLEVIEVAYGADIDVLLETHELLEQVKLRNPDLSEEIDNALEKLQEHLASEKLQTKIREPSKRKFVGTSCCPSWVQTARNYSPKLSYNISESDTPMVESAIQIKEKDPDAKIVMIGPCVAKKWESLQPNVKPYVDFVITFEELAGMLRAKNIDLDEIQAKIEIKDASQLGRGFPIAGGVSESILKQISKTMGKEFDVDKEIPVAKADTLRDCRAMLKSIEKGTADPMPLLVEGMACPFGCIGGAGTLAPLRLAKIAVARFKKDAKIQYSDENPKI